MLLNLASCKPSIDIMMKKFDAFREILVILVRLVIFVNNRDLIRIVPEEDEEILAKEVLKKSALSKSELTSQRVTSHQGTRVVWGVQVKLQLVSLVPVWT